MSFAPLKMLFCRWMALFWSNYNLYPRPKMDTNYKMFCGTGIHDFLAKTHAHKYT